MNKHILFFSFSIISSVLFSQGFTWKHGSKFGSQSGIYGVKGVAAPANTPGSRNEVVQWTDLQGNFWLFGGWGEDAFGNQGLLNDLWKFNPGTNQWTWMSGDSMINKFAVYGTYNVSSPSNKPASTFKASSWRDNNNNLWFYGGWLWNPGNSLYGGNHLWRYSISNNEWTYMTSPSQLSPVCVYGTMGVAGPNNIPADRIAANACADAAGNGLLFGGQGPANTSTINGGYHNDLWRYDVTTNMWTWIAGTTAIDMNGIYGTLGLPSLTVVPGARHTSHVWSDAANFWIFGGNGMDAVNSNTSTVYLNDIWRYNLSSGQWTWLKGSNTGMQPGTYGTQGVFSTLNNPGGHCCGTNAVDAFGRMWLFGGHGITTPNFGGKLGDLWQYDPLNNQWAHMDGYSTPDQNGIYGTINVPSPSNRPGCRHLGATWVDNNNDVWTFGGFAWPETGMLDVMNDLWKYTNCSSQTMSISNTPSLVCGSGIATITASGASTYTWSTQQNGSTITPSLNFTSSYTVNGTFANGCVKTSTFVQFVVPNPFLVMAADKPFPCYGDTVQIAIVGANTSTWSTGATGSTISAQVFTTSSFSATGTAVSGCTNTASITINVVPDYTLNVSASQSTICIGESVTLTVLGAQNYLWNTGAITSSIVITPSTTISHTVTGDVMTCQKKKTITVNVATCDGLDERSMQSLQLFPNPANEALNITTQNPGRLIIYNLMSEKILDTEIANHRSIDCSRWSGGVYTYQFESVGRCVNGKLLIE